MHNRTKWYLYMKLCGLLNKLWLVMVFVHIEFLTYRVTFLQTKIPWWSRRSRSTRETLLLYLTTDGILNSIIFRDTSKGLLCSWMSLGDRGCWCCGPLGPARHYRHIETTTWSLIRWTWKQYIQHTTYTDIQWNYKSIKVNFRAKLFYILLNNCLIMLLLYQRTYLIESLLILAKTNRGYDYDESFMLYRF